MCRLGAFENPQIRGGNRNRGFWIPLQGQSQGGLASPIRYDGSPRVLIGSSKVHQSVEHRRGKRILAAL